MSIISNPLMDPVWSGSIKLAFIRFNTIISWNMPTMKTPNWRFYLPLESGGIVTFKNLDYALRPGTGMLIAPMTDCASRLENEFKKLYCHFTIDIPELTFEPGVYKFKLERKFFSDMKERLESNSVNTEQSRLSLRFSVLEHIAKGLSVIPENAFRKEKKYSKPIEKVMEVIHGSGHKAPDNSELAKASGLHQNSFIRLFTSEVGLSPQKYVMNQRLETAARLLSDTTESIDAIAEKCAFWDRNHFTRLFTRQWSVPPATYRKLNSH